MNPELLPPQPSAELRSVGGRGRPPYTSYTVSGILELRSLLLDSLPGAFHMAGLSVGLADAEPKGEFAIELGIREVKVAAAIQPVYQELIGLILISMISGAQTEADEVVWEGAASSKRESPRTQAANCWSRRTCSRMWCRRPSMP